MTDPVEERRDIQVLLHRILDAIVRYRRTVVVMVVFALLQVLFTKLPFLLVEPLISVLGEAAGATAGVPDAAGGGAFESLRAWFATGFRDFADELAEVLGLHFDQAGMNVVVACGVVTAFCGICGAAVIYVVQTVSRFFAYRVVADLRCELARHFLALPLRFFGKRRMGEMISKVTNDTQVMQRSFEMAADNVVVDPLMVIGNMVIILMVIPEAIVVMLVMLPLMVIPMYRQGKKVQKRSTSSLQAMGETTESLNQILTGIRTVKAFQLEEARYRDFEATTQRFLDRTRRVLRAKGRSIAQSFIGYQMATAIILVLLGYYVLSDSGVTFAAVSGIIAPLATNYQHVKRVTRAYNVLRESAGALSGIEDILRTEADTAAVGGAPIDAVKGDVELRDVHFAYDDKPVLHGLSLRVTAGETVALVGESGGGKSTTLDLLLRFHDPASGAVLVDGRDLRDIRLADYRRHTAVVSQQPFLFNATLRENIACGRPGASQAEIEQAARAANIHDFICSQPDGYDTMAGERGANLSGGQMQRITIARAILRNPAILFLDEATSALDTESEEVVQQALHALMQGRTSFVIAHRLSTIVDADRIVVLEDGRIVESGSHDELIANDGSYRRMFDKQMRPDAG
ncbi:MAG TPA: ABC transporter ATP-binding protein [bacterium]|nr:ABC transporter ATP-binding protein [bacterium]